MQRLIISDTHLGKRFNENKYNYLKGLFSNYDEIILNGDFWDYYLTSFDDFINSSWQKLFPIMKDKTVYVYGNHDKKKWSDKRVEQFSKKQAQTHHFRAVNTNYIVQHGHRIEKFRQLENTSFIKFGRITGLNSMALFADEILSHIKRNRFKKIEEYSQGLTNDEFLITGHKHIPIINKEKRYAVTGSIIFGRSCYLEMNEKGDLKIIKERF